MHVARVVAPADAERFRDLSSLDDPVVRFEMMWADPVATDHVPVALQRESPRFNFGARQFAQFKAAVGCKTLIRGHEQIDAGFSTPFDLPACRMHTVFSAVPWAIQYAPFCTAAHNGLYR